MLVNREIINTNRYNKINNKYKNKNKSYLNKILTMALDDLNLHRGDNDET